MDLIYKIYSVWLYQNQLKHDWVFFYNRRMGWRGELHWDAPYTMFSSSDWCANTKIHRLLKTQYNEDKNNPQFLQESIDIMKEAAKREGIQLINAKDYITLIPIGESQISYSGALPGQVVETEGKYKGLKKNIYTPYNVMWNETKSGINPHEFEVMGIWKAGDSSYSCYRIWEEKDERLKVIRDNKINSILI